VAEDVGSGSGEAPAAAELNANIGVSTPAPSPPDTPERGSPIEPTPHTERGTTVALDGVSASIDLLRGQLDDLASLVRSRLSYDQTKEQAFDRLYAELDALKKNAALDNIKPLLLDLILLYDRMEHARQLAADAHGALSTEILESFIHELLEVLYRREVGLIEAGPSSFDYNQQKAIGVVDVTDPAEHQRIHKVVRRGFRLGDRTLRPEEVIVCRVLAPPPSVKPDTNEGRKT
jgi:molecular chaperone GrpE (heat shock protein)